MTGPARPMRVFIASLATETNTFGPLPTIRQAFEAQGIGRDASRTGSPIYNPAMGTFRAAAEARGAEIYESITVFAQPGGRTLRAVYEEFRDTILSDLQQAGDVDIILLSLHGAMAAEGYDDCEGDLLARARALNPASVIGAELDPHCHLTSAMLESADAIVLYKEYPHVDLADRARELVQVCFAVSSGEATPVTAVIDMHMIGAFPTSQPPMSDIVAYLGETEQLTHILSASIAHGFPWGDVIDVGARVLVISNGDIIAARSAAKRIAQMFYDKREALTLRYPTIIDSLHLAASLPGTVVLGDYSDNPGGGAPGDSTFFLREMLRQHVTDAAIGCFHDPAVVGQAVTAGLGATIDVDLGGRFGAVSGEPVSFEVEVLGICKEHFQSALGLRQPMGTSVWLRHEGIDIAVSTIRAQVYDPDLFTGLGIDLRDKRLIVAKSSSHYEAGFRQIADHLWSVQSEGAITLDFSAIPYTKRSKTYFPILPDPWADKGVPEAKVYAKHRHAGMGTAGVLGQIRMPCDASSARRAAL